MNPTRGMDLRKAIKVAERTPGVTVHLNGRGDLVFACRAIRPSRFAASSHRRDTPWGLCQFLKKARAAAEAHR